MHRFWQNVSGPTNSFPTKFTNPWDDEVGIAQKASALPVFNTAPLAKANSIISTGSPSKVQPVSQPKSVTTADTWFNNLTQSHEPKAPLQSKISPIPENRGVTTVNTTTTASSTLSGSFTQQQHTTSISAASNALRSPVSSAPSNSTATVGSNGSNMTSPLNSLSGVKTSTSFSHNSPNNPTAPPNTAAPNINTTQPQPGHGLTRPTYRGAPTRSQSLGADPFDATWAEPLARTGQAPTNPFVRQQTFQVSM